MMLALAGLGAGALHVVSGPDHLAALGPVAARAPERAIRLGVLWGVGHGLGVLALAGLGRFGAATVDLHRLSSWAELAVGVVLVLLGARALRRAPRDERHAHQALPVAAGSAVGVGVLHGAAGAHHLFAILPGLLLEAGEAAVYLSAYLFAAILAMACAGALLAAGMRGRGGQARRRVRRFLGLVAIGTGTVWIAISLG